MCGIAGFVTKEPIHSDEAEYFSGKLNHALRHRGPDSQGYWLSPSARLLLAHSRLAIMDLSSAGAQPMTSRCGRYAISYNGEIYNAAALARELGIPGPSQPESGSDTRVLLEAIATWGLTETLPRLNGMFAAALYDHERSELILFRDRLGKKPLSYGFFHHCFGFASELKALREIPNFSGTICQESLAVFLRLGYLPAPHSILQDVFQLRPGHILRFCLKTFTVKSIRSWWQLQLHARADSALITKPADAVTQLNALLEDAVRLRLQADVKVGVLLSGGVDSSLVAATASALSSAPLRTYTMGFADAERDESAAAAATASTIGAAHTCMRVTDQDVLGVVPELSQAWDEPFADSSQIPSLLLCRLARQDVTVCLGGDGGDELFAGYERQRWARRLIELQTRYGHTPMAWLGRFIHAYPKLSARLLRHCASFPLANSTDKLHKLGLALQSRNLQQLYSSCHSLWTHPLHLCHAVNEGPHPFLNSDESWPAGLDTLRACMFVDQALYLGGDLLAKADRASMYSGLELRSPLLDHRIVEMSWRLPEHLLIHKGEKKWLLEELLRQRLPGRQADPVKKGFGVPLAQWLRGPLRSWAQDLLASQTLDDGQLILPHFPRQAFQKLLAGHDEHQHRVWAVLMFLSWHAQGHHKAPL